MNNIVKSLLLSLSISLFATPSYALDASPNPIEGSQVGVAYLKPHDNKIYGANYDTYMHPASTLKVITGLAAILYLGHDYKFITNIAVASKTGGGADGQNLQSVSAGTGWTDHRLPAPDRLG